MRTLLDGVGVASSMTKSAKRPFHRSPLRGIRPKRSMQVAGDRLGLVARKVECRTAPRGRRAGSCPRAGYVALAGRPRIPARSSSYSSWIGPSSSSMTSSIVARPAVPPCSSTTIAMWVCRRRISRKRSSARLNSGTRKGGSQVASELEASSPRRRSGRRDPSRAGSPTTLSSVPR